MPSDMHFDWQEVVALNPRGYLELQNENTILHGPIERVFIDKQIVHINLKWAATMGAPGKPHCGRWKNSPQNTEFVFTNFTLPFVYEQEYKGLRIRFGANLLYIEPVKGLDPSQIAGFYIS